MKKNAPSRKAKGERAPMAKALSGCEVFRSLRPIRCPLAGVIGRSAPLLPTDQGIGANSKTLREQRKLAHRWLGAVYFPRRNCTFPDAQENAQLRLRKPRRLSRLSEPCAE